MTKISALSVKALREKSGAGMMDCKKALTANDGNMDASIDWLRTKGLAVAAKKSGRIATEGLIGLATNGISGAVVEVNSETDFVARNPEFQTFVRTVAGTALLKGGDFDQTATAACDDGKSIQELVTEMVAVIGENLTFRRSAGVSVEAGIVSSYVHNAVALNLGKIGVLVALETSGTTENLIELGRQLAMHIAAANPKWVSQADVEVGVREREREILAEQARASGKPEEIVQKMLDGRMKKFFEEVCLLDQLFVIDGESRVGKVIESAAGIAGAPVSVKGFIRYELGEGIQKEVLDFAAEVAATAGE
ncbi:MAG: translation elongation factor Ts [Pseudomonadota bacterium]|nr:translation elongation factor Ts [Pseudomonadota bacterium]